MWTLLATTTVVAAEFIDKNIIGKVTYQNQCGIQNFSSQVWGYYRNVYYHVKKECVYDFTTKTYTYTTRTWKSDGVTYADDHTPYPLDPLTRRNYTCVQNQTDPNGDLIRFSWNGVEDFVIFVENKIVSQTGMFPYQGPFPFRVVSKVTPLQSNCTQQESTLPVSDYTQSTIALNQIVKGLKFNLVNRQYGLPFAIRNENLAAY
jgi:hypothetical protein